jgi:hypothetical protein
VQHVEHAELGRRKRLADVAFRAGRGHGLDEFGDERHVRAGDFLAERLHRCLAEWTGASERFSHQEKGAHGERGRGTDSHDSREMRPGGFHGLES